MGSVKSKTEIKFTGSDPTLTGQSSVRRMESTSADKIIKGGRPEIHNLELAISELHAGPA